MIMNMIKQTLDYLSSYVNSQIIELKKYERENEFTRTFHFQDFVSHIITGQINFYLPKEMASPGHIVKFSYLSKGKRFCLVVTEDLDAPYHMKYRLFCDGKSLEHFTFDMPRLHQSVIDNIIKNINLL